MVSLLPGTEVVARGLSWEVVLSEALGQQTLFRLRGLAGEMRGREIDILHPFERIDPVIRDLRLERAAPLQNWLVYHQAFLLEQALGPDALLSVQPGRLRIEPYQLTPVMRALRMSRVRLMLADGVGLGKTIQAGLIVTELMARRIAHRLLIVSPAGPLLEQWKTEMGQRFGLRMEVIDRPKLEEIRRSAELGANPFDHIPLGLASIDFLKQERVLEQLERTSYDIIIVDEAHHCMDLGTVGDREDSQRRRLAELLARQCDALILATATPHDGNDRSFASLCELLDPSLVDGRGVLRGERYRPFVIRRLKRHIVDPQTGEQKFKERVVEPRPVHATPESHAHFIELQRGLLELLAPELRRAFRARRYSDVLAFLALLKRSVSTVSACLRTLTVVAERFQQILSEEAETQESRRQRLKTLRDYNRKLERFGTVTSEEEQDQYRLEAEDLAQQLAVSQREIRSGSQRLSRYSSFVEAIDSLIELAEVSLDQDPKIEQLIKEIQLIRSQEPGANILVYTEYVDSQKAAARALKDAEMDEVLTMSGNDIESVRAEITDRFRTQNGIILVSTDASAEGLNLHDRCHHLIHLELPFNPNRLEQRNGRIDRYGQPFDPTVRYLYLQGTFEERILMRLIAKYERQRKRLTFVPNTLGLVSSSDTAQERLLKGIMDDDTKLFREQPTFLEFSESADEDDGQDEATRELLEEVDRSLKSFEQAARTNLWLGEQGLNAEQSLLAEADQARQLGERTSQVDLGRFVCDAARLDGGSVKGTIENGFFEVKVPPSWRHGLDDIPGFDSVTQAVLLTNHLDCIRDVQGRPVGFLGRAHPLVRRALDRVRHHSLGNDGQDGQDPRVSAVQGAVAGPTLLFTFLGRVASQAGRELERVLAVKVSSTDGGSFYENAHDWQQWADPSRAIRTTDVYNHYFASWYQEACQRASKLAQTGFAPLAQAFVASRQQDMSGEQERLGEWLGLRALEITGSDVTAASQMDLFVEQSAQQGTQGQGKLSSPPGSWVQLTDPAERLAGFASDPTQLSKKRFEAEGVLKLYQQRQSILLARMDLKEPIVDLLGVLMIVPEVSHGA